MVVKNIITEITFKCPSCSKLKTLSKKEYDRRKKQSGGKPITCSKKCAALEKSWNWDNPHRDQEITTTTRKKKIGR